jgi:hypothetical protein
MLFLGVCLHVMAFTLFGAPQNLIKFFHFRLELNTNPAGKKPAPALICDLCANVTVIQSWSSRSCL